MSLLEDFTDPSSKKIFWLVGAYLLGALVFAITVVRVAAHFIAKWW